MNLAELTLRASINKLSNLSISIIKNYLNQNKEINPILLLGNLFYDCSIKYSYSQMKNYISNLQLELIKTPPYTHNELIWIKFYLLYKFNNGNINQEIIQDYKHLPKLKTTDYDILEIQQLIEAYINFPL